MATSLQPVNLSRSPRYREVAYAAIKDAILRGQLEPNQPLVEEQLATLLNISRTPVREALAILEHEGLIGARNGRGLYICTVTREQFVEMFVANEAVEPFLVRRAAQHARDEQFAELAATLEQAEASVAAHDVVGFLRASRTFHRLIGVAAGNAALTDLVVRNEERTDMYLLSTGQAVQPTMMEASNREHAAILRALQRRDPEAAARLTIYHAQSLRVRLGELFSEHLDGRVVIADWACRYDRSGGQPDAVDSR
ncbi:GntR family transcriptional regulator [Candidatus Gracilibacteria bacterium]|nr:GntR family transcriptional regulator [Candidatus Gracilibacteria bacterium]